MLEKYIASKPQSDELARLGRTLGDGVGHRCVGHDLTYVLFRALRGAPAWVTVMSAIRPSVR